MKEFKETSTLGAMVWIEIPFVGGVKKINVLSKEIEVKVTVDEEDKSVIDMEIKVKDILKLVTHPQEVFKELRDHVDAEIIEIKPYSDN
jgi:hypothetical protein